MENQSQQEIEEQKEMKEQYQLLLDRFHEFLKIAVEKGGPLKDYHVIFRCGTVVRLNINEGKEFEHYDTNYEDNFPHHRMKREDQFYQILDENKNIWEKQRKIEGDIGISIRKAFKLLIEDGYPYPGGQGADRFPISLSEENDVWILLWTSRNVNIFNLVPCPTAQIAVDVGGECRRIDFISPSVRTVITPDLQIIHI